VINYRRTENRGAEVLDRTGGRGVDHVPVAETEDAFRYEMPGADFGKICLDIWDGSTRRPRRAEVEDRLAR
jgi:hypothetical protein